MEAEVDANPAFNLDNFSY
jgi:hypothetical protein